jgi:hypothetical protein
LGESESCAVDFYSPFEDGIAETSVPPTQVKMSKATRAEIENIAQVLSMNPGMDGNSKVRLLKQLTRMLEKPMPEHLNILNMGSSE